MTYKDKAQELVQKHIKYAYVQRLKYVCASVPIEEARKQNAIEAALITVRECREIQYSGFSHWWDGVIAELESMKNQ